MEVFRFSGKNILYLVVFVANIPHRQSTSFTSMGSLVRVQYRPHKKSHPLWVVFFLCLARPGLSPVADRCLWHRLGTESKRVPHPQSTHCSLGAVALLVSDDSFRSLAFGTPHRGDASFAPQWAMKRGSERPENCPVDSFQ